MWWQWARLQLAKSPDAVWLLEWMQESRLTPEVISPHQRDGFKYALSADGSTALILVTDGADHVIWRIPSTKLTWALSLYPIFLKRLPNLEPPEKEQRRRLQTRLKKQFPFMTPAQREEIADKIEGLAVQERKAFAPVPRFALVKYQDGRAVGVHRLFLDAGRDDEVEAVDGDYTNFGNVTIHIETKPVAPIGQLAVRKGDRSPYETQRIILPNLYICNSDVAQETFEKSFLEAKTRHGDVDVRPLRIQPNADLGTQAQYHGEIVDAGEHKPVTTEDAVPSDFKVEDPSLNLSQHEKYIFCPDSTSYPISASPADLLEYLSI